MNLCDQCETVAHCLKHGCIPIQQPTTTKEPRVNPIVWIKGLHADWRERRRIANAHREAMAGFEYALSALRDDRFDCREQLEEQADSSPDSPFCLGMQIALKGWRP